MKGTLRKVVLEKWQERWDPSDKGRCRSVSERLEMKWLQISISYRQPSSEHRAPRVPAFYGLFVLVAP